ncbi:MAG: SpoIIE family protein phosphatase [Mariprofundus sp.]|nr:SpoIIE family protein phosphatase [Mariprofundus sp.]
MSSADKSFWSYLLCLWPLLFIFLLGQVLMRLNGNAAELGVTASLSLLDSSVFLLMFGAAAWWTFKPIKQCLCANNDSQAEQQELETVMSAFPWRALKAYWVSGWVFAAYLIIIIPLVAVFSDQPFTWRMFVTLALNFCFASGIMAPALAVTQSVVFATRLRLKLSHDNLFSGLLNDEHSHQHITSSTHRSWLIFLVTGLLPTLILALYVWLARDGNDMEASFILSQAIVLLIMSITASLILVWHITQTLKTVTTTLETGLNHLANGQFEGRVPILLDDDFGELARGLNTAMQGLQEREDLKDSLALAAEIQQGLLPKHEPMIPFYSLKGFQKTCFSVGGDYYDYIKLDDDRIWLMVADVSGKGYPAALTMANLQAMLRGLSVLNWPIEEAATYLNDALCDTLAAGRFVTLFMAKLQPESHSLVWVNAGHVPPLLLHTSDSGERNIKALKASSPPLGLIKNMRYEVSRSEFHSGDTLLAYTDGVTESSSRIGKDMFGEARLRTWFSKHAETSVDRLPEMLLETLNTFGRNDHDDDLTLLCVKREKLGQERA